MDLQQIANEIRGLHLAPVISPKSEYKSNSEIFHNYAEIIRSEFRNDFCACTISIDVTDCNIFQLEKYLKSHLRGKKVTHFGNWIQVEKI